MSDERRATLSRGANISEPPKAAVLEIDYENLHDHHFAADFDLLKPDGDEFKSLVASIAENGFRVDLGKIMLFEGKILDGRNRYRAGKAAKYKWTGKEFGHFTGDDAEVYVSDAQRRRSLTMEDKKAYAKKLIDRHPDWNIRKLAEMAGISKSVIAELRRPVEDTTYKRLEKAWLSATDEAQIKFVGAYRVEVADLLKA
jgi:hypothetical protein